MRKKALRKAQRPRNIAKLKLPTARTKRGFHFTTTSTGRRILTENKELLSAFKYFRDHPRYKNPLTIPDDITIENVRVTRIAGKKEKSYAFTRFGVFLVRVNGKRFVFKVGRADTPMDGKEMIAEQRIIAAGLKSVHYHLKAQIPSSKRYFVLMKYENLPRVQEVLAEKPENADAIRKELRRQKGKLNQSGLVDVKNHNCFFKRTQTGFELIWFDLRVK